MKTSSISFVALAASLVSGTTLKHRGSTPADAIDDAVVGLTWTGAPFPGGDNITLTGTVESILHQIREINPEYDATPESRKRWLNPNAPLALDTSSIQCKPVGELVYPDNCRGAIDYLYAIGGTCYANTGRDKCARVGCTDSCGIYLCNDNSYPIGVPCTNVAGDANFIIDSCIYMYHGQTGIKGQVFRQDPKAPWNTIVKRAQC